MTKVLDLREYDFDALLDRDFMPPTCLFPRQAWVESGGYKDFGVGFEDWEFWITLGELEYFGIKVGFPIYHYRQRTGSMIDEANKVHDELYEKMKALHADTYGRRVFAPQQVKPILVPTQAPPKSVLIPAPQRVIQMNKPAFLTIAYTGNKAPHTIRGPRTNRSYRIRSGKPITMPTGDAEDLMKAYPDFVRVEGAK